MEQHIVVVDQTVSLLRSLRDSRLIIDTADKEILSDLSSAFNDVFLHYAAMFSQFTIMIVSYFSSPEDLSQNLRVLSPVDQHSTSLQNC